MASSIIIAIYSVSTGGEGVAYHNIPKGEPKPELNHIRVAGITIDPMNKQNVALNQWVIGWTGPGEWMSYKVLKCNLLHVLHLRRSYASVFYHADEILLSDACVDFILLSQVTAAAATKVQATWLVARGLNPAVPCGYSILIDAPVPKNPADMCTSAAANKAKV
jgi:hypothetical protein